jgi:hypothetical protein
MLLNGRGWFRTSDLGQIANRKNQARLRTPFYRLIGRCQAVGSHIASELKRPRRSGSSSSLPAPFPRCRDCDVHGTRSLSARWGAASLFATPRPRRSPGAWCNGFPCPSNEGSLSPPIRPTPHRPPLLRRAMGGVEKSFCASCDGFRVPLPSRSNAHLHRLDPIAPALMCLRHCGHLARPIRRDNRLVQFERLHPKVRLRRHRVSPLPVVLDPSRRS